MAPLRPEPLSPRHFSMLSPDIPESYAFTWAYRGSGTQSKYTIEIMDIHYNVLHTHTSNSVTETIDAGSVGYAGYVEGSKYLWTVTTYDGSGNASPKSIYATFAYDSCPAVAPVDWTYVPKTGDVITNNTYFKEIKDNLSSILLEYNDVSLNVISDVNRLFTGDIVPSKDDFELLELCINYIYSKLEMQGKVKLGIEDAIEDSLGVSDLDKIRKRIDAILNMKPKPIGKASIDVPSPSMYSVHNLDVVNDGKTDPTMDIKWSVDALPSYAGTNTYDTISPSKDIRYYLCVFKYGPSSNLFSSELYFKADSLYDGKSWEFDTDWDGLYTSTTIGLAQQSMTTIAVDHRGNSSSPYTVNKTYGTNFKAPLGVNYYEISLQKAKLGDVAPDKNGSWTTVATTKDLKYTYKVTGGEGRVYFRVRAVDLSGLTTDWVYDNGVTFDPLTPPAAPGNFHATEIGTTYIKFDWNSSARAESYELVRWLTPPTAIYSGTNTYGTDSNLSPSHSYNFYVRAVNRVGHSDWVGITLTTKSARKTSEWKCTGSKSWRNNWGWRNDTSKVYQGEWCNNWSSDHYVEGAGSTCWGKHMGLWFFDSDSIKNTLAGKKIVSVKLYIKRQKEHNGAFCAVQPSIWLHNYSSHPSGQPSLFGNYTDAPKFSLGEEKYIDLPIYYGEYIRDGKAKGVALYLNHWKQLPYMICESAAWINITYE